QNPHKTSGKKLIRDAIVAYDAAYAEYFDINDSSNKTLIKLLKEEFLNYNFFEKNEEPKS
uniref:hypothetical protein n=1 Tax=Leptospira interrogans TaxID=173 RepID=UPI0002BC7986